MTDMRCWSVSLYSALPHLICVLLTGKVQNNGTIYIGKVVKDEDFPSLSSEDLVKLILCNDLAVPFEEKVKILYLMHLNLIYKSQFKILPFKTQLGVNLDTLVIHQKYDSVLINLSSQLFNPFNSTRLF
ncbi:hypothetical protein QTP88_000616 [Uroleucon formosanum]